MKQLIILLFLVFFNSIFGQIPAGYYDNAQGLTGDDLKTALHNIINNHHTLTYSQVKNALKFTDEDPSNTSNVILLYTGWSYPKNNFGGSADQWNREHTWAKSHGNFGTSPPAGTDLHHLRPTDTSVNSKRGNKHFDNGGTLYLDPTRYNHTGNHDTGCRYTAETWEPRDEVKGDVARMIFYMAVRYEGDNGEPDLEVVDFIPSNNSAPQHGVLSTLLQWHQQDPVSDWERRRNNRIYYGEGTNHDYAQWNRNPFIDHPEWVNTIWNPSGSVTSYVQNHTKIYPNPVQAGQNLNVTLNNIEVNSIRVFDITGKQIQSFKPVDNQQIHTEAFKQGVYFLQFLTDKGIVVKKLVIE